MNLQGDRKLTDYFEIVNQLSGGKQAEVVEELEAVIELLENNNWDHQALAIKVKLCTSCDDINDSEESRIVDLLKKAQKNQTVIKPSDIEKIDRLIAYKSSFKEDDKCAGIPESILSKSKEIWLNSSHHL